VILKNKLTRMTAQKSLSISFFTLFLPFYLRNVILFIRTRGRVALTVWKLSLGVWNSALCFDRGRPFSIGFQCSFLDFPLGNEHCCIYCVCFQENLFGYQCREGG